MKAANPRLRVLRYVGALTNNDGPIFNIAPTEDDHGTSFLRDASGDFVRAYSEIAEWNGKPSYAFDLTSIDVRNNISAWARQFGKMGYDGILLDGISPCVPAPTASCATPLLSAPLDKTTNRPYTDAAWREATIGLLAAIRHTLRTRRSSSSRRAVSRPLRALHQRHRYAPPAVIPASTAAPVLGATNLRRMP